MDFKLSKKLLLKKAYFSWKRVAPIISLVLALSLITPPASNAAANYKIGSKFELYMILIFTDLEDALSSECNSLTGKWAKFLKAPMIVKNGKGKILSTTKGDFRYSSNYSIHNDMVKANIYPSVNTIMSFDQCVIGISSKKMSSSESVYKVSISGLKTFTYTRSEITANFVNGMSSFELLLY